jgi:RimJ/RimL family protein N-acetyltransferase
LISVLETPRLILKPLELSDAEAAQALFPRWEIVRYLAARVPWPYPSDGVRRFYEAEALPAMARGDAWHWSLRLRTDPGTLIGCISLERGEEDNRGFWLGLPYQGQGLMTEACDAVTDYWFDVLGFPVLRVPKAVANAPSRRISEKQGMLRVCGGEREYVGGRIDAEIWELTAELWRKRREVPERNA